MALGASATPRVTMSFTVVLTVALSVVVGVGGSSFSTAVRGKHGGGARRGTRRDKTGGAGAQQHHRSGEEGSDVGSTNWLRFYGEAEYFLFSRASAATRRCSTARSSTSMMSVHECRSCVEMERRFKVYVYEEGEPPILYEGSCKNIYTIEGRFIEQLKLMAPPSPPDAGDNVRTWDPMRAHTFFLLFSVSQMMKFVRTTPRSVPSSPTTSASSLAATPSGTALPKF
ncbi:hypothetical protein E2562_007880 [Oryza meyeriana var. granulata]|uniref:Uncharacterized protein n=1 Tax=Oryza meyeriana var. granulata TaxID=110450 RepID=A0A6G1F5E0_9ORYZ|nr:hypothetical protein E2562_007880 [Oryza meyeriana var. granulata]